MDQREEKQLLVKCQTSGPFPELTHRRLAKVYPILRGDHIES